jgi:hypothetical protein
MFTDWAQPLAEMRERPAATAHFNARASTVSQ